MVKTADWIHQTVGTISETVGETGEMDGQTGEAVGHVLRWLVKWDRQFVRWRQLVIGETAVQWVRELVK